MTESPRRCGTYYYYYYHYYYYYYYYYYSFTIRLLRWRSDAHSTLECTGAYLHV